MSTVVSPSTGKVTASFAGVANHYAVTVKPCPPRRGNRKGVVGKANHVAAQRFWRTVPDVATVATVAKGEPLTAMPAPHPAVLTLSRVVSAQALVSYRGNPYSVPPELHGATVTVSVRLGGGHLDIASLPARGRASALPTVIARHALAPAGATIRSDAHVTALEQAALAASTNQRPHRSKERRPPSPEA